MEKLTNDVLERLYKPVGEIVIQWAMIDLTINHLAFAIFRHMGTTPTAQGWPIMMGYRLSKLKTLISRNKDFAPFATAARELIKDIEHHQDLRDMLSHGAAVRYDRAKDAILFQRIDSTTKKQRKRLPEITHRNSQMLVRFTMLAEASTNCTSITLALLDLRSKISRLGGWA